MKKLSIAVNTRLLLKDKLEGIGWFTFESLKRIVSWHPEVDFTFIFDREPDPSFLFGPNVKARVIAPPARHPLLFYCWFNFSLPRLLKRLEPDLFLSPDGYHALPYPGKSLVVIHDLNFEHYPRDLPPLVRAYYRYFFPKFASHASRIATVSEFSKTDISQKYDIPASKIDVVYDGVNELFSPLSQENILRIRQQFSEGKPYFIFIGSLHPRKNLVNLFKAFDLFKQNDLEGTKLVIAGAKKWWTPAIEETFKSMQFNKQVIFTGRLSVPALNEVLGASLALVYVSYFEGFGIPLLEAFACGIPVITSNRTSLPEIAGQAALVVDPFDPIQIAAAMQQLSREETLRHHLVQLGYQRRDAFSWDKTAGLLWDSMLKTIQQEQS